MARPTAPDLGRGGLLHADPRHRLPHAVRPPAAHPEARPERAGLGRLGRPRLVRGAALRRGRRQRHRRRSPTTTSAISSCSLGAKGVINRKDFKCWGQMPTVGTPEYDAWIKEARKFGKAIWDITGKGNDVDMVFEHPGESTFPVSCLRGEARRHGRHLRRHHRLQPDHRRPLRVDAPEARPGLALRQSAAGEPGQPAGRSSAHRSVHVRGLPLGRHPEGPQQDVEERAPARQHGRAGQRAAHRPPHLRETCSRPAARCTAAASVSEGLGNSTSPG